MTDATNEWLTPAVEQQGLRGFLETIRSRWWIVLATTAALLAVAVVYLLTAPRVYEADAQMFVTPIPSDDPSAASLGLIVESVDPTLAVQTAAQLITTVDVAERASGELAGDRDPESLLDQVTAESVGQSNIIAITGSGSSPEEAQGVANAFATAVITQRTDELHARIDDILPRLTERLEDLPPGEIASQSLADEIALLESFRAQDDPSFRIENPAQLPTSPVSPRPALTLILALVLGILLGTIAVFVLKSLDPRLRSEEQLRAMLRLPVLGRIPRERNTGAAPLAWRSLSSATMEGYRGLRSTLAASGRRGGPRSILVTGSTPSEGKTTTACNLAYSLALTGSQVILIEADVRRPAVGQAFGVKPAHGGIVEVLIGQSTLDEALIDLPDAGSLKLLVADQAGPWASELFLLPTTTMLLEAAIERADYVIIDSPPLTEVVDALPLAQEVDAVLVVLKLGHSRLRQIKQLAELLASNGVRPAGFAVVGTAAESSDYYYQLDQRTRTGVRRAAEAGQTRS